MDEEKKIIDTLYYKYKIVGYVLNDEILDLCTEKGIRPLRVDYICKQLLGKGVLITDKVDQTETSISKTLTETGAYTDYSQTDYDSIYNDVLELCPSMKSMIAEMKKIIPLQKGEPAELFKQFKSGNKYAYERLAKAYMRNVLKLVYYYRDKTIIPIEDLFSVGMQGVIQGIDEYDPTKNGYLTSYINLWIKQKVDRYIANTERFIRIPVHAMENVKKILELEEKYAYLNSHEEIKNRISKDMNIVPEEIEHIFLITSSMESLEELLENGWEMEDHNVNVEDDMENKARKELLLEYISSLPEKNKKVILYRYGFYDGREHTLNDIGQIYGITRERVRQIEAKALEKIKGFCMRNHIKG